jgi:1-acyl-sn-glycerol-3-phosphate acyltransferase
VGRAPRTTFSQKLRLAAATAAEALRPWVRGAARGLYALYLALVLPLVILPVWLAALLIPSRGLAFALGRLGTRVGLSLMGCRLSTTGLEHVPREGAVVLACNHASYTDVFALVALLPRNLLFVAKREVLGYPVIRTFVRRLGYPTVDRLDFQQGLADAEQVTRALANGAAVVFFPEGTFVAATGLRPFRLGAFKTAADAGVPVVPMALRGTRQLLRGDETLLHPGPIHLDVGEPLRADGDDIHALVRLRDRTAVAIGARCGEPRLDLVAAGVERRREG